jgi:excisionase family DNA binding protein
MSPAPSEPSPPPPCNVAEVALRLHLHRTTVRRLARNGSLPMFKLGKQWFMARAVLQDIIDGKPDQDVG